MTLRLTLDDTRRLSAAAEALLSPAAGPSRDAWWRACELRLRELFPGASAMLTCQEDGQARIRSDSVDPASLRRLRDYIGTDAHGRIRNVDPSIEAWLAHARAQREELWDEAGTIRKLEALGLDGLRNEFYNEALLPARMHGSFGLCTSAPGGELFLTIGYDRRDRSRFADGDIDVVSLLLPAWRAAHHTLATYGARWAALAATIDAAPEALLVVGADGRERHRSAALRRELAAEPERDRLVAAMLAMAADLAALRRAGPGAATAHAAAARADASRTVVTALGRYTLHAAFAPPLLWGIDDAIHVTVAAAGRDAAPLAAAADGSLTAREREVARLLARRATNAEVAAALGLSGHTARRHTERVLQKLGVRSRTAVATALAAVEG